MERGNHGRSYSAAGPFIGRSNARYGGRFTGFRMCRAPASEQVRSPLGRPRRSATRKSTTRKFGATIEPVTNVRDAGAGSFAPRFRTSTRATRRTRSSRSHARRHQARLRFAGDRPARDHRRHLRARLRGEPGRGYRCKRPRGTRVCIRIEGVEAPRARHRRRLGQRHRTRRRFDHDQLQLRRPEPQERRTRMPATASTSRPARRTTASASIGPARRATSATSSRAMRATA